MFEFIAENLLTFLLFTLAVSISNWFEFKKLEDQKSGTTVPMVSVLVPMRDEEQNAERCIRSLAEQSYSNYEIIVLDDASTDRTYEILSQLERRYANLKVIKGKELPKGWLGKHWACHQLSKMALGEYILFTDADTVHSPATIDRAVSTALKYDTDLLTAFVHEETLTFGEKLSVPFIQWIIFAVMPTLIGYLTGITTLSATVGQFMFFKRVPFEAIGGYESVKGNVTDDMALGKLIIKNRYKWRIYDATDLVSCRMYHNFSEVYAGFSKNMYSVFGHNPFILIICWAWFAMIYILPVVSLTLSLA